MPDEFEEYGTGARPHRYTGREVTLASLQPAIRLVSAEVLPSSVDLRSKQSPVFKQNWGTCVIAEERSDAEAMEIEVSGTYTKKAVKLGYYIAKQVDGIPDQSGTFPYVGKQIRMGVGLADEELHPDIKEASEAVYRTVEPSARALDDGNKNLIAGVAWLPSVLEKKQFLARSKGRGFGVTVGVYSDHLKVDSKDNCSIPPGEVVPQSWHRIYCVGYDDNRPTKMGTGAWLCKNSWGKGYGDDGYMWIPYQYGIMDEIASLDFAPSVAAGLTSIPQNLAYPVDEPVVVTQVFGARPEFYKPFGYPGHMGVDFRARLGAKIYAIDGGTVVWAASLGGYGKTVKIRHSWGYSWYSHLNGFNVSAGAVVGRRHLLGESGQTGNADAPHLHLNGQINGVSNPAYGGLVDLLPYIKGDIMLPMEGFATHPSKPGEEVYYAKIVKWDGALELARIFDADSGQIIKLSEWATKSKRKGFVFGNDGKLVAFYYKISSQDEKKLVAALTGVPADSAVQNLANL